MITIASWIIVLYACIHAVSFIVAVFLEVKSEARIEKQVLELMAEYKRKQKEG